MEKNVVEKNLGSPKTFSIFVVSDAVQMKSSTEEWFRTTVGVRQGCLLSLTLFNNFLERIMTGALEEHGENVGRWQKYDQFAGSDDIDALAESEQEIKALVESTDKTC